MILLGLGSNMGEREHNLQQALYLLTADGEVSIAQMSSIYESAPFGVLDQPEFLNMVVQVETALLPEKLLNKCLNIENKMGRKRTLHWGPRIIDIDLLVYENVQRMTEDLTLPHPGIVHRAFVLLPMRDVARDLQLPGGQSVESLLAEGNSELRKQELHLWKRVEWNPYRKCFVKPGGQA